MATRVYRDDTATYDSYLWECGCGSRGVIDHADERSARTALAEHLARCPETDIGAVYLRNSAAVRRR